MKFKTSRRAVLLGALAVATQGGMPSGLDAARAETAPDPTTGRKLIFDDGFAMIDPAVWNAGPKASTFDTGFYGRAAFSRIEGEEGFNPYEIVDDDQASNGKALQISAKYIGKPMNVPKYYGNNLPEYQWVSGNLQTAKEDGTILQGWREGYFEARIWMPAHPLTFPAFWLMNGNSILKPQTSVEIDIIEHKGHEHDLYGAYLHEWGKPGEHHEGLGVEPGVDITSGYFRYGLLIEGGRCRFYFERKPVVGKNGKGADWTIGRAAELDANKDVFWPLLTLALLNDVPFPNPLREEDKLARMRVDYMQVYA